MQMLGGRPDASGGTANFNSRPQSQKPADQSANQFDASPEGDGFDDIPF